MKRASILVVTLVMALSMAVALCGCTSNNYTPQAKEQTISNSALKSSGTLRVGVNASNAPYAAESSGSIVGIDVDIAAALADELGLKLELVDVGSSVDTAFTKDNVDIVMGVAKSNSAYWMSDSYMSSAVALFSLTQNATAPTQSGSFSVAAQSSSMSAWEVTDHYGESCLRNSADLQGAFESLQTGSVNYVAADSTIGAYVVHSSVEAYPVALLQDPSSYCIAAPTTNVELQKAVSEALSTLKNGGVISVIQKKWLGDQADISALKVIQSTKSESDGEDAASTNASDSSSTGSSSSSSSSNSSSTSGSTSSSTKSGSTQSSSNN